MSQVNIKPQELQGMISKLRTFGASMNATSMQMQAYANSLAGTWKDSQYNVFLSQIQSMGKQLKTNREQMEQMAKQLATLKQNLEKAQQDFQRMQQR